MLSYLFISTTMKIVFVSHLSLRIKFDSHYSDSELIELKMCIINCVFDDNP